MRVIGVTSGKGGVGKTTVSVNLAVELAKQGKRVVLLDSDLGLSNAQILLNAKVEYSYGHVLSGQKTLQTTGDYFKITRERVRQITSKYLKIIERKEIKGLKIFNKINDLLKELCPIQTVTFEQYLIENKIVKKRFATNTILSLLKHYIKINTMLIPLNKIWFYSRHTQLCAFTL